MKIEKEKLRSVCDKNATLVIVCSDYSHEKFDHCNEEIGLHDQWTHAKAHFFERKFTFRYYCTFCLCYDDTPPDVVENAKELTRLQSHLSSIVHSVTFHQSILYKCKYCRALHDSISGVQSCVNGCKARTERDELDTDSADSDSSGD